MSQSAPPTLGTAKPGKSKEEKEQKRRDNAREYRMNFAGVKQTDPNKPDYNKFVGGFRRYMDYVIEISQALDTLAAKLHAGSLMKDGNGVMGGKGVSIGFAAQTAALMGIPANTIDGTRNSYFTKRDLKHLQSLFRTNILKRVKKVFQFSIGRAPATAEQVTKRNNNARRPVIADPTLRDFITTASRSIGLFNPGDAAYSGILETYMGTFASDGHLSRRAIVKVIRLYTLSRGLYTVRKINTRGQDVLDGARFRPDELFLRYFRNDMGSLSGAKPQSQVTEGSFPIILLNKLVSRHVAPLSQIKEERDRMAERFLNNDAYIQMIKMIDRIAAAWAATKATNAPKKTSTTKQKKKRNIISKKKKTT